MAMIKRRGSPASNQPEQEIVTLAHKLNEATAKYRRPLVIGASLAAAFVILWGAFDYYRSLKEQQAAPLVATAYELYKPAGAVPGDLGRARDLFLEVVKKYPRTVSAAVASYYAANCLADAGRADDAIKEYQEFIKQYGGEKFLLGLVYQRLGYTYAQTGKRDDSRKAFEQAEALLGPGVATMELARQYEAAGNQIEAEKKYKTVLDKLAGTSWAMEAMGKVQRFSPSPLPAAGAPMK
ncbi:MAG TPA: tetratricopeptide repeat protein [Nitrospirota bacterium]|nr:tetratricopeptide repeat protein [Nitrospirota bacterium]